MFIVLLYYCIIELCMIVKYKFNVEDILKIATKSMKIRHIFYEKYISSNKPEFYKFKLISKRKKLSF